MPVNPNQFILPFCEREWIDVKRAMAILGVSHGTILNMHALGLIEMIDYSKRKRKRVKYSSIVEYCDELRIKFCIKDRRPQLASKLLRHRDEDILPFPLSDTIGPEDTLEALAYEHRTSVVNLIEEGKFDAYQLVKGGYWRISRKSFLEYLDACSRPVKRRF